MRRPLVSLLLVTVVSGLFSVAHAQWGRWGGVGEGNLPPRFPPPTLPDRDFAFCKLMYEQVRYEQLGMGVVHRLPVCRHQPDASFLRPDDR